MLLDRSFILPRHFCTLLMNVPWRYCSQLQICNALIPIKVLRPTVKCCQNCMGSAVCVNSSWLCKSLVPFQMQDKKKEKTPSTDQKKNIIKKSFLVYLSLGFLIYLLWYGNMPRMLSQELLLVYAAIKHWLLKIFRHTVNYEPWWGPAPSVCLRNKCGYFIQLCTVGI